MRVLDWLGVRTDAGNGSPELTEPPPPHPTERPEARPHLEGLVFERRARSTHSVRAQPSEDNPFRPRRARPTGRARATGRGPRPDTRVSRGRGAPRPTERPAPPARVNGMHLHFRLQEDPPTLSRKREGGNNRERPTTLAPHTRVTTPASLAAHDGVPSPRVHPDATLGDFEQIEQSERCTCSQCGIFTGMGPGG